MAGVLQGSQKSRHGQVPEREDTGLGCIQAAFQSRGDQGSSVLRTHKNHPHSVSHVQRLGPAVGFCDLPRPRRVTEAAAPHPRGPGPRDRRPPLGVQL